MLIYDVETLKCPEEVDGGWENPEGMNFGTAVVFDTETGFYYFFGPDDLLKLREFLRAKKRMGFNNIKFDDRVIYGNKYHEEPFAEKVEVKDLLIQVVRAKFGFETVREAEEKVGAENIHDGSLGLNGLSKATLGFGKTGHGSKSPLLIREGKWAEVFEYNLNDVRLTHLLIEHKEKYGFVVDGKDNVINF